MPDIFIAPLNIRNEDFINLIISKLKNILPFNVTRINLDIPLEETFSSDRNQYYSTKILAKAVPLTEYLDGKVVMLLEHDLFIPIFTYVFGEAQLKGKLSIVSFCRLHEELYSGTTNNKLLLERALKEILHELGHNFGLIHCDNWDCVMHQAAIVEEVDIRGDFYCKKCKKAIGF